MNNLISIIIPVFNSESTIIRCLESIKEQDYSYFEAIIINDGSTDSSETICQSFCLTDSRFSLISIPNGGVSRARNYGLNKSIGEWICFVDADDYLERNYLSTFIEEMKNNNAQLILTSWFENDIVVDFKSNFSLVGDNAAEFLLSSAYGHNLAVWNKMFSRDLIGDNRFDESLYYLEDGVFIFDYFKPNMKLSIVNVPTYHYYVYDSSLSHNTKLDEKRLSSITSKEIIADKAKLFSSKIERIAKAKCFEQTVYVLFHSYLNGQVKDVKKNRKLLIKYFPEFIFFDPISMKMRIRYYLYFLIMFFNLGPTLSNKIETYRYK